MKKIIIASAAFLAAASYSAGAGFYVGGSLTTTASSFDTAIDNFESDEMGWKAFVGWDIMKFIGIEAGYRDLGNISEGAQNGNIDFDLVVLDASARAFFPIGKRFTIFAKAGYANISYDGEINIGGAVEDFDEDDWELFYGVGADFSLGKNWAIRAEWEMYDVSDDLSTLSAGLVFRF